MLGNLKVLLVLTDNAASIQIRKKKVGVETPPSLTWIEGSVMEATWKASTIYVDPLDSLLRGSTKLCHSVMRHS